LKTPFNAVFDNYAAPDRTQVMGSNSVNVFLGLGMPWTIGALYWTMQPFDEWDKELQTLCSAAILYRVP
jgi:hypothetical protein